MIKKIFFLIYIFSAGCYSTEWATKKYLIENNYQEVKPIGGDIHLKVKPDAFAMYPNGLQGINDLITANVQYPEAAREKRITGEVIIKFIVEKNGHVGDISVYRSVDSLLDNESIRVIKLMKRWVPGKKNGKPVRMLYRQPFNFKLK